MKLGQKSSEECSLCGCSHRAYVYSKVHSRVVYCTNCGLLEDVDFVNRPYNAYKFPDKIVLRLESLICRVEGGITLITSIGGGKSLQPFLEKMIDPEQLQVVDFESVPEYKLSGDTVLIDDHLFDQVNLVETLRLLHDQLSEVQNIMFLVELVRGNHNWLRESLVPREVQARFWPDWPTFHKLLIKSGFNQIWLDNPENDKYVGHLETVSARIGVRRERPLVSVIMPIFNEFATFSESIGRVLQKEVAGVDIQVIIVESNSTDGTKELVSQYDGHDRVEVIWQENPRGKGSAVREGLIAAKGDIILIQDGDLEYDVNDYDALIDEITSWRSSFVLGSRHTSNWKMRKFNDMPIVADMYNLAHIFFVWFINFLLKSGMRDPFTMYKVFRRDCIYGLNFRYNRFDFDHEIVMKLYRKGFHPTEIPVNYEARSFSEGKKVSFFKDGISWIHKDIRIAYEPLAKPNFKRNC